MLQGLLDSSARFLVFLYSVSCLSVRQLNELAREALSACFHDEVWVQGEIHGLKVHAKSGHVYFDLVEKAPGMDGGHVAKIGCAFFRGSFVKWRQALKILGMQDFELAPGIEVRLKARIDLFVREGRYQLIVSEIDPAYTFGAIARKREQTIRALDAAGLLERNKTLQMPRIPRNVGLITSDGSAAFNDFMRVISESGYSFSVTLFDAHMQGENTVPGVLAGIEALQGRPGMDVIVIIRGGGAKTDLFSFDDLSLCRAVARCARPVITGIGHEIDVSVADLVAHTCCVTPTDAGRFLTGRMEEMWAYLDQASRDISHRGREVLQIAGERLRTASSGLGRAARQWMVSALSDLRECAFHLHTALTRELARREQMLVTAASSLTHNSRAAVERQRQVLDGLPQTAIRDTLARFSLLRADLARQQQVLGDHAGAIIARQQDRMEHLGSLFSAMEPLQTLRRGYSITTDSQGRIVADADMVRKGASITTVLARGRIVSTVKDKEQ